ncbi:6340_t:CDS:10, partial [Acaulospora morrowiae]
DSKVKNANNIRRLNSLDAATNETLTKENWDLITVVCEKVEKSGDQGARDCISAIQKRLAHRNANVQLYALTLSNSLVRMCGNNIRKEISSRTFTTLLTRILTDKGTHETVRSRILDLIQEWTIEFRSDPNLGLMEETFNSLRSQKFQFPSPEKPKKEQSEIEIEKRRRQEEEQIQLAMKLSLESTERKSVQKTNVSSTKSTSQSQPVVQSQERDFSQFPNVSRVRALYDFTPSESGELGFSRGDVITVLDSVYKDWWRGELHGKTGIFPVNYVEKLPDPTPEDIAKEADMEASVFAEGRNIDQLLEMLAGLDSQRDSVTENEAIQNLYNSTLPVRPKLMKLIEKYSQKKDDLIALHKKFIQATTTYDRLMSESLRKYDPTYLNGPSQYNNASINSQPIVSDRGVPNYAAYGAQPYAQQNSAFVTGYTDPNSAYYQQQQHSNQYNAPQIDATSQQNVYPSQQPLQAQYQQDNVSQPPSQAQYQPSVQHPQYAPQILPGGLGQQNAYQAQQRHQYMPQTAQEAPLPLQPNPQQQPPQQNSQYINPSVQDPSAQQSIYLNQQQKQQFNPPVQQDPVTQPGAFSEQQSQQNQFSPKAPHDSVGQQPSAYLTQQDPSSQFPQQDLANQHNGQDRTTQQQSNYVASQQPTYSNSNPFYDTSAYRQTSSSPSNSEVPYQNQQPQSLQQFAQAYATQPSSQMTSQALQQPPPQSTSQPPSQQQYDYPYYPQQNQPQGAQPNYTAASVPQQYS